MQAFSEERTSLAQTVAVSVATMGAIVLLGLVLAYWTWVWFAPRPEPSVQSPTEVGDRPKAALELFGISARTGAGASPTGIAVKLIGVVAAPGGQPAYALLRMDGMPTVAASVGTEVAPGVRLAEVHADGVILERGGMRESVALPERGQPARAVTPAIK